MLLAWPMVAHAQKTDVITLRNGDKITGEVKGLSGGKLDYKTDDVGRLSVEWVKVAGVSSTHIFEVEMSSGTKFFGRLAVGAQEGLLVVSGLSSDTLEVLAVVAISELEAGILQRTKAFLDVGTTLAKANQAKTLSVSGEAAYRGDKMGSTFAFDSYAQGQDSVETTSQNSASLEVTRFLQHRSSALLMVQAQQNTELDLLLRLTGGAGVSRVVHQSNKSEIAVGAGLAVTQERYSSTSTDSTTPENSQSSLEAVFSAEWSAFQFDSPKLDFATSLRIYPSLSSFGRVRGEFGTRVKYEVVKDFHVGINFTDTFDSQPPEADAAKNDFIFSLTIGWSYRR